MGDKGRGWRKKWGGRQDDCGEKGKKGKAVVRKKGEGLNGEGLATAEITIIGSKKADHLIQKNHLGKKFILFKKNPLQ